MCFRYPGEPAAAPALAGIDLRLRAGEFVLLCGPSGGGKSTLLRLCLGLVPQFSGGRLSGRVSVLGHDPAVTPPRRIAAAGATLVFQNPAESFIAERVGDEVAFGPENLALPVAEVEERVREGLAAVGLAAFEGRRLRDLSAGQQQRVALAGALALRPRLLLLDEPTAHLDDDAAREVLAVVARLHREQGVTVVLSEHRLGLAAPLADRILVLAGGRLIRAGAPRAVLGDETLPALGVPVPRAAIAAVRLGLRGPLPLTPEELAEAIIRDRLGRGCLHGGDAGGPPSSLQTSAGYVAQERQGRAGRPPGGAPALVFDGVTFAYPGGPPVLDQVSLTLAPGEVAALMGPSGAGKTTLARLALGLLRPQSGRIELCGYVTHRTPVSTLARLGGLVLQNPLHQLLASRVDDEVRLGLRHLPPAEAAERAATMLETFGLRELQARHPLSLSEGERRRLALAAVLARRPQVLILDEPTLGQDERTRLALGNLIRRLAAEGMAVLVISHDVEFVNDACDRVLLLRAGRIAADLPLHLARDAPARLREAGLPLADVPATALCLSARGCPVRARRLPELLAAMGEGAVDPP
jgi:energy-coupling factor transport system ATP-binding protein